MRPGIAAIIVSLNRRELLLRTVESLGRQSLSPGAIIVVDNGSTDDSVPAVRALRLPRLEVLELGENVGSAGGFQRGVEAGMATGAETLLVLDSDVVLDPDCVQRLFAALAAQPQIGVVGPKVYHSESRTVLQEFGGWIDWDTADLRRSHWRHDEAAGGVVTGRQVVDYVPACCLLASRAAVEAAGNFDPGWFLYWDDIDWCTRVRRAGLSVVATAAACVHHFGGGANKRNLVPVYYGWRNRLTFFRRFTCAERRSATLRAFFDDFLLARFTCRALGLRRTASVMELGVDDALADVSGKKDLSGVDLALDPAPAAYGDTTGGVDPVRVHHVIGSATSELAAHPGVILKDRFGKRLPAAEAWALRQTFEVERERELPSLLARAMR